MAYRIVCPVFAADPTVTGHGTEVGYSNGGALSHAERCEDMNGIMAGHGVNVELKSTGRRGIDTEDEFFAAAAAKLAARSQPVASAPAAEDVVVIDGKTYRRA